MSVVGIDEGAVSAWIGSLGIGAVAPISFERIGNGQSNLTYAVRDASGGRWVLRRPPMGTLLASAHDVLREHRIMSSLQGTAVPVPKMVAMTADGGKAGGSLSGGSLSGDEAPLVLMSYVDGIVIGDLEVSRTLSEERRAATGFAMPETLGKIHAVDLESTGLLDLASHKPYAGRQLKRWSAQWAASKTRDVDAIDRLAAALGAAAPEQTELSLVHGDFHLANVITSTEDGSIVAVVDWELSTLGDPLADLGALLAYWPQKGDDAEGPIMASTLDGFPTRDQLVETYAAATGRDVTEVGFWHTLALWKLSIIAEGVMRRVLDDERNRSGSGGPTADLVDKIIARAVSTAEESGIL